jgi:uncharacterized membrane protein YdfJ with MMPL/SSD domain
MFAAWGRFVYRFRWLVLVASILSIAAIVYSMQYGGRLGTGEFAAPEGTESGRVDDLLDEEVTKTPPSFMLIFGDEDEKATDPAFRDGVERALEPLEGDDRVTNVRTAYENGIVDEAMISKDEHHSLVVVEMEEGSFSERQNAYVDLRQEVRPGPFEVVAAGEMPLNEDFERVTERDLKRAEAVSLPLALLMLLFVFGSVVAAGLPIGVGVLAVTGGFVGTLLLARVMDVSIYATNIVTMIGLGVAIDYSLFVVSRFREEVVRYPVSEALARTMATAGRAILFSGLTVAIGFMGFLFFDVADLNSIGFAGSIVVAFSVVYGLTFLPALLAILGPRVDFLRLPFVHPAARRRAPPRARLALSGHPSRPLRCGHPFQRLRVASGRGASGPPVPRHQRLPDGGCARLPARVAAFQGADRRDVRPEPLARGQARRQRRGKHRKPRSRVLPGSVPGAPLGTA